ncbi:hypothetical protein HUJ04_003587 [Dendroctonus ponderosae]|nr:hypothetical protein HUJ04_003587 [Dendroctonus ponderosae]
MFAIENVNEISSFIGNSIGRYNNLNDYLKIHKDSRPFQCDILKSKFRRKYDLIRHSRGHMNDNQCWSVIKAEFYLQEESLKAEEITIEEHDVSEFAHQTETTDLIDLRSIYNQSIKEERNEEIVMDEYDQPGLSTERNKALISVKVESSHEVREEIKIEEQNWSEMVKEETRSGSNQHILMQESKALKTKKHNCAICSKSFLSKSNLNSHLTTHSEDRPFQCDFCGLKFKRMDRLKIHRNKHTKEKQYNCKYCNRAFLFYSNLHDHLKIHSENRPHSCEMCNLTFKRKDKRTFKCKIYKSDFKRKSNLNVHLNKHTKGKQYSCNICNKKFLYSNSIQNHMSCHLDQRPFQCDYGKSTFKTKENLNTHRNKHTKEKEYSIDMTPDFCMQVKEEITIDEEDFYGLVKIEDDASGDLSSSETTYEQAVNAAEINQRHCTICSISFINNSKLSIHLNECHAEDELFQCIICGFKFKEKWYLTKHMSVHTEANQYPSHVDLNSDFYINVKEEITIEEENMCVLVKVEEETISNMSETETVTEHTAKTAQVNQYSVGMKADFYIQVKEEITIEEQDLPALVKMEEEASSDRRSSETTYEPAVNAAQINQHSCNICSRCFINKYHLNSHSDQRPFQCEFCNSTFKTKKYLNIHLNKHTKEKEYKCEICNKIFYFVGKLSRHLVTHSDKRPFQCDFCDKTFKIKDSLRRHARARHFEQAS